MPPKVQTGYKQRAPMSKPKKMAGVGTPRRAIKTKLAKQKSHQNPSGMAKALGKVKHGMARSKKK